VSWDCPYWNNVICELNRITCTPGNGKCVLRNRYEITSGDKNKINKEKDTQILKKDNKRT
jgi:hypothetical protein